MQFSGNLDEADQVTCHILRDLNFVVIKTLADQEVRFLVSYQCSFKKIVIFIITIRSPAQSTFMLSSTEKKIRD